MLPIETDGNQYLLKAFFSCKGPLLVSHLSTCKEKKYILNVLCET